MKKKSIKVAAVAMISSVALAAGLTTACGHAFTDEWTYDATNHWHACVEPDCNEKLGEAAHVDENEDGKCDVCQYVLKTEPKHEHAYDGDWQTDGEKHWKECTADGCTDPKAKSQEGDHVYDDDSDKTCNTCGYERHIHAYDGEWQTDGEKHWKECTADGCTDPKAKSEEGDHVYDNKRDDTCNDCGYVRTLPLTDEAEKFKSDVQALGEINENSVARIDGEIPGLKADYDSLDDIDKANDTVIAAKAELDEKETAVETFKTNAATAVAALKAEIDKIDGTAEATEEYYAELEGLLNQVDALGTYSKTLWNTEDTTTLKGEITRVVRLLALVDVKNEIDATVDTDKVITASVESKAYYNSLVAIKEKINGLYLKDLWAEAYAESDAKLNKEITRVVTAIVSTIKTEVDKIDGTAEATETYLASLKDLSAQIEDLDEACKALWDANDTTKLQTEITRVTQILELTPYKEAIDATVDTEKVIAADDESKAYYAALKKIKDDIAEVEGDLKTVWETTFADSDAKLNNEITRVVAAIISTIKTEVDKIDGTAEATETYLASLKDLSAQIEDLDEACKALWDANDTTKLQTEITRVTQILELNPYKEAIDATVDTEKVITASDESKAYYAALKKIKDDIAEVEGDLKTVWETTFADSDAKLNNEITRVLNTVVETKTTDMPISYNNTNSYYYIVRNYINLLGDSIEFETAPTVTYQLNSDAEKTESFEQNEKNGAYIFKISFHCDSANTITYQVSCGEDKEEEQTLSLEKFKNNPWTNTTGKTQADRTTAFNNQDKLVLNANGSDENSFYAYVYRAEDIDIGDVSKDSEVKISGTAIAKVKIKAGDLKADIFRNIKNQCGDLFDTDIQVRLVFIAEYENEGALVRSKINSASTSELIDLTKENAKYSLEIKGAFDVGVWGNGDFTLIGNINNFISQFEELYPGLITADNVVDYFQIAITAYAQDDTDGTTPLFVRIAPFKNRGYNYNTFMTYWKARHFINGGEDGYEINFYLTLTIQLKPTVNGEPNPLTADFRNSSSSSKVNHNNNVYTGTETFNTADVTPTTEIQFKQTNEPIFAPGFTIANDLIAGHISCVEIHFADYEGAENYNVAYMLYNEKTGAIELHSNEDGSDAGLAFAKGGNEYWKGLNDVNVWFRDNYGDDSFNVKGEGWYFRTKIVNNEEDAYYVQDSISDWETF